MDKLMKAAFVLVGTGFIFCILFHAGVMMNRIPLQPNHILYANLGLIFILFPGMTLAKRAGREVSMGGFFETTFQVFPVWLTAGLGSVLTYGICVFIYYTYIHSPMAAKPDMPRVVGLLNRGTSAATLVFYTVQFWLLNLYWRVSKKSEKQKRLKD